MSLIIRAGNTTFEHYFDTLISYPENLKIHFDFGGTIEKSKINKATGLAATVLGNPTVKEDSVIVNNKSGFEVTGTAEGAARTYIAVTKSATNTIIAGHSNYDSAETWKDLRAAIVMTYNKFSIQFRNSQLAPTADQTGVGEVTRFIAAAFDEVSSSLYINSSNALSKTTETPKTSILGNEYPFRVAGHHITGGTFPSNTETFEVLYFDRVLTESEITSLYQQLKSKYASRGVAIA